MTYFSANHYSIKSEKNMVRAEAAADRAEVAAAQASQASGKVIQLGFDGSMENGALVFKHAPGGVEIPYDLLDDYEYEIDMAYSGLEELTDDLQMYVKNGDDNVTFVSALHRDSSSYVTVGEMKSVMRFNSDTGYRWLFKAAYKVTPSGVKVLLLYPVAVAKQELAKLVSVLPVEPEEGVLYCIPEV